MKILFVDDEEMILQGMKRSLRRMARDWEMHFCTGGAEALELLEREPCDVVVSDMRMPLMDGAQLLREVQSRYPQTIRIVLSGHAEMDAVMSAFGVSHQYLAKPCDAEKLRDTIARTQHVRALLANERLRAVVARISDLPSLPEIYQQLVTLLQDPDSDQKSIAAVIEQDVSMSATVLKAVNSAYFGHDQEITTVSRAVAYLGLGTLANMVLGNAVFRAFEVAEIPGFNLRQLWAHSFQVAAITRHLVAECPAFESNPDDAYVAGMLHDIGRLVFAAEDPETLAQVLQRNRDSGVCVTQAEIDCIGVSHAEMGAYLISLSGFATPVVEALALHESTEVNLSGLAAAVHIAERLSHAEPGTELADAGLNPHLVRTLPVLAEQWPSWLEWRHNCESEPA